MTCPYEDKQDQGFDADRLANVLLNESRTELERVDTKVLGVLGFAAVFVAVIVAGMVAGDWGPSKLSACGQTVWWIGAIVVVAGVMVLAAALWPRVGKSKGSSEGCVTYFGDIDGDWNTDELLERLGRTCRRVQSRGADQLLTIAPLVTKKYRLMQVGMALLGTGLVLAAVSVFL